MLTTVKPKASDTPTKPMPISGNLAASTALPHPPKTSQKVPMNSAVSFFDNGMAAPSVEWTIDGQTVREPIRFRVFSQNGHATPIAWLHHTGGAQPGNLLGAVAEPGQDLVG